MRVLHVCRTYHPHTRGGIEETVRQICLNTRALGVHSRILCVGPSSGPRAARRAEALVYYARINFEIASCSVSLEALAIFRRLLRWADLVHYHFPWPFADLLHFAARVRLPAVLTYHSDIVRQRWLARLYSPLMHRLLHSVDRIICTSPNYLTSSPVLARFADNVSVVPIGLDRGACATATRHCVDAARARYGQGFSLFIGRLCYYKGLHTLLDAARGSSCRVVIAGAGPLEAELRQRAGVLGLTNVVFTGLVSEEVKAALIKLSRCVVLPSPLRSEGFGVTLLEGAMHGKALISADIGSGTSYVNVDGVTGFVVAPASPGALRLAMQRLHEHPDLAHTLGLRARRRFERLFSGRRMGERHAAIYASLAARPAREARTG